MATPDTESLDFDPSLVAELDHLVQPLKRWLSPVSLGIEHVPREGAVLLAGNHTIYGLLDIPMLYLEIYEQTGRAVRGLSDHNHFALPIWRDLLRRMGAVRGTREICGRLFEAGDACRGRWLRGWDGVAHVSPFSFRTLCPWQHTSTRCRRYQAQRRPHATSPVPRRASRR